VRATRLEQLLALTVAANLAYVVVEFCIQGLALFGSTTWERVNALLIFAVMVLAIVRVLRGDVRGLWMCFLFYVLQIPQFTPRLPWIWINFGYNPLLFADPRSRFDVSWTAIILAILAGDVLWLRYRRRRGY